MTITISRLYSDYATASRAVQDLEAAGVPHSEISIVASNADNSYSGNGGRTANTRVDPDHDGIDDRAGGAAGGAGVGATVAAAGRSAWPSRSQAGPVVAAGCLHHGSRCSAGGATGGIIGTTVTALAMTTQVGAEGARRGRSLTARVLTPTDATRLLDRSGSISASGAAYRKPLEVRSCGQALVEQVRKERDLYATHRGVPCRVEQAWKSPADWKLAGLFNVTAHAGSPVDVSRHVGRLHDASRRTFDSFDQPDGIRSRPRH